MCFYGTGKRERQEPDDGRDVESREVASAWFAIDSSLRPAIQVSLFQLITEISNPDQLHTLWSHQMSRVAPHGWDHSAGPFHSHLASTQRQRPFCPFSPPAPISRRSVSRSPLLFIKTTRNLMQRLNALLRCFPPVSSRSSARFQPTSSTYSSRKNRAGTLSLLRNV